MNRNNGDYERFNEEDYYTWSWRNNTNRDINVRFTEERHPSEEWQNERAVEAPPPGYCTSKFMKVGRDDGWNTLIEKESTLPCEGFMWARWREGYGQVFKRKVGCSFRYNNQRDVLDASRLDKYKVPAKTDDLDYNSGNENNSNDSNDGCSVGRRTPDRERSRSSSSERARSRSPSSDTHNYNYRSRSPSVNSSRSDSISPRRRPSW